MNQELIQGLFIFLILIADCSGFSSISKNFSNNDSGTKAIYGIDDREFISDQSEDSLRHIAKSIALIVAEEDTKKGLLKTLILGSSMIESHQMCKDERYATLPTVSGCTGFLVGKDLMASAGHCFVTAEDCKNKKIFFDVLSEKMNEFGVSVSNRDVYSCKEIIVSEVEGAKDYALIRLDREASGRSALLLNRGDTSSMSSVFMIGHPYGLPLIHSKSVVVEEGHNEFQFKVSLDSFVGNSGSPVINTQTLEVEGILVNGQEDLVYDSKNECYRNQSYEGAGNEGVFRINRLLPYLN